MGQRHDYDVSILSANADMPRSTAARVDGVIVVDPLSDDLRARELMLSALPVVAGEHLPPGLPECEVVAVDHRRALSELLAPEAARGVTRPLLVAPDEHSGWGNLLRDVFDAWAADLGAAPAHGYVRFGGWDDKEGFREVLQPMLQADEEADFVLVSSPYGVLAGLEFLAEHSPTRAVRFASAGPDVGGLLDHVPEVGFVDLPARALGAACAERLIELLEAGRLSPGLRHHAHPSACASPAVNTALNPGQGLPTPLTNRFGMRSLEPSSFVTLQEVRCGKGPCP
ncbi:hypothetical protein [Nesterenkonia pannonica]|uniref:hypothetical protein n=1 Tax=Nesterenkonia pannonica TaxID=1548602 RepID=UPI0021648053|nr:hypothetical protein [Nesterenkonia pannonica]